MNSHSNCDGAALPRGQFTAISPGEFEGCALLRDGTLECYGYGWRQMRR